MQGRIRLRLHLCLCLQLVLAMLLLLFCFTQGHVCGFAFTCASACNMDACGAVDWFDCLTAYSWYWVTLTLLLHAGARVASPTPVPVPTVLVTETPADTEKPKLLGGLLTKKTLNTFPTPEPPTQETPAPDTPTLEELLKKKTPAATPVESVFVPITTTVPAVAVSGKS